MAFGTSHEYLYRVLRPEEDPSRGLWAQDWYSDVSIVDHVAYGSKLSSRYISTCASMEAAIDFAEIGLQHGDYSPKTIVKVDAETLQMQTRAKIIDLTLPFMRQRYLGNNRRANSFAQRTEEVLVIGKIPRWCIVEEFSIGDD